MLYCFLKVHHLELEVYLKSWTGWNNITKHWTILRILGSAVHVLIAKLFLQSGLWCDQVLGGPSGWWWCFVVSNRYEVDWNIFKNEILTHKLASKWTSSLNIWVSCWLIFNKLDDYIIDKIVNHWRKILLSCCNSGTAANKLIKRVWP